MPSELEELDFVELEMMSDGFFKNREFELLKTRKIMWAIIQVNSKKKVKEESIFPLSLDAADGYEKDELLTHEDIKRIREKIKWNRK